jgi:hypothetical protein
VAVGGGHEKRISNIRDQKRSVEASRVKELKSGLMCGWILTRMEIDNGPARCGFGAFAGWAMGHGAMREEGNANLKIQDQ